MTARATMIVPILSTRDWKIKASLLFTFVFSTPVFAQLYPTSECQLETRTELPRSSAVLSSSISGPTEPILWFRSVMTGSTSPAYVVSICMDGNGTFLGEQNVRFYGTMRFRIPKNQVAKLLDELAIKKEFRRKVMEADRREQEIQKSGKPQLSNTVSFQLFLRSRGELLFLNGHDANVDKDVVEVLDAIERVVPTRQLRCPAYPVGVEDDRKLTESNLDSCLDREVFHKNKRMAP